MDNQFETQMESLISKYRTNGEAYNDMMKRIEDMRKSMAALDLERKKIIDELRDIRYCEKTLMDEMLKSGLSNDEIKSRVDTIVKKMAENVK